MLCLIYSPGRTSDMKVGREMPFIYFFFLAFLKQQDTRLIRHPLVQRNA